jgi:hypothetical protein
MCVWDKVREDRFFPREASRRATSDGAERLDGDSALIVLVGVTGEPNTARAAKTSGPVGSINLLNDYGSIHPGINQLATCIDGSTTSTPIYVAPKAVVSWVALLTPVERPVLV